MKQTNEEMNLNRDRARNRNILYVYEYLLEHPCVECGETDPMVLEFDHIDRENKRREVSMLVSAPNSIELIDAEIAKCRVLCRNCHIRHTAKQFNWKVIDLIASGAKSSDYIYNRKSSSRAHIIGDPKNLIRNRNKAKQRKNAKFLETLKVPEKNIPDCQESINS